VLLLLEAQPVGGGHVGGLLRLGIQPGIGRLAQIVLAAKPQGEREVGQADVVLVEPARSASGYRLYGPPELQRLRTLRELLAEHDIGLSDIAFARRLREEAGLRRDAEAWLEAEAERPDEVPAADWLRFEQEKHQRLLAAVAATN